MVKAGQQPAPLVWTPAHRADELEVISLRALAPKVPAGVFERPEFHIVVCYTGGRTRHEVDFESHPCTPGRVIHVAPGQVHRFALGGDVAGDAVIFTPAVFMPGRPHPGDLFHGRFFEDVGWPTALQLEPRQRRAAMVAVAHLARIVATRAPSPLRPALLSHALAATLLEIAVRAGLGPAPRVGADDDTRLVRAFREATERSFKITRSALEYATALGCAPRTLDRAAHRAFGVSAKGYVAARVILEAKRMLAHTDASVVAIAEELGFTEPTNFVKFFRARTGEAPGAFRAARRGPRAGAHGARSRARTRS